MAPQHSKVAKDNVKDVAAKDQALMVNHLKRHKADANVKATLDLYQSLPRFDAQKKELINAFKSHKSCKWIGSWKKSVSADEASQVTTRNGYGARYNLATFLELPPDSTDFKKIEASLLKQGLADDLWDEKLPVENAYKKAGLKRWNLDKVTATYSTLTNTQGWTETVEMEAQGKDVQKNLSTVLTLAVQAPPQTRPAPALKSSRTRLALSPVSKAPGLNQSLCFVFLAALVFCSSSFLL